MTIEEYLDANTYRWKKYGDVEVNGERVVVVTEFAPSGEESNPYALLQKNGKVFNLVIGDDVTVNR